VSETIFLQRAEVERRCGLSRSTIYARMAQDRFPKAVHDLDSPAVWWVESEVDAWIAARKDARDMGTNMGTPADDAKEAA
jgi:prophage regulatory protein